MNLRLASPDDLPFLEIMLYEAFFWNPDVTRTAFESFRKRPEFEKLLAGWGRPGDTAYIAEINGVPAGAAWYRFWTASNPSYGFVDERTPELGLAVASAFRRQGIGRKLLNKLIGHAKKKAVPAISLSVDPNNHARHLYESEGFEKVGESGTSWTYVRVLHTH